MAKPNKIAKAPIMEMSTDQIRKDLERCRKSANSKALRPQSVKYYLRRAEMLGAELGKRS